MGRRELSIFNFKFSIFNSNEELLNMLIHIVGDGGRYLLFVLDEEFMAMYEQYEQFDDLEDYFIENEEEITAAIAYYVDEHIEEFLI